MSRRAWPLPTGRLVLAASLVAIGVLPSAQGAALTLVGADLVLLGLAVVDALRAPDASTLVVTRQTERNLVMDDDGEVVWAIRNLGRRSVTVHLTDTLPPSLRADRRRARLRVPSGGRAVATTAIRPARRGAVSLGTVTIRIRGPWGLVDRQSTVQVAGAIRVYPRFPSREVAELKLVQALRQREGLRTVRLRGQGTEFDSLREYTPDDETRRIDWAATARARRPIVRTYRAERNQQVLVLLDHGRTMAGRMGRLAPSQDPTRPVDLEQAPRLEHAMDAVMALTRVATGMGDRVGLVAFADVVTAAVPPRAGSAQLTRVVEALADVEARLVEPDYRGAFADALVRFPRRALVVVVTDLAAAPVVESLQPALPLLGRRHLTLVASPTDPAVLAWTRWVPTDPSAAFRMAAATRTVEERQRAAERIAAAGAIVVDAEPARLAGRLIDTYLDVKSAGRL